MEEYFDFGYSEWVNPSTTPVVLDLCVNANAEPNKPDYRLKLVIPPQGTVMGQQPQGSPHQLDPDGKLLFTRLDRRHDPGIQQVRDGQVVGGHGTRLRRNRGDQLPLAPGIDAAREDHNAALREAQAMLQAKNASDEALILAAAKQLKAEQAVADSGKAAKGGKQGS